MKPSVKLKFCRWDLLVAAAILAAAILLAVGYWGRTVRALDGDLSAVVFVDGTQTDQIALSSLSGTEERTYSGNGYTLTVSLSRSGVCVETSDCPNQDCVHTGTITHAGQSIVCLPARISIQLTAEAGGSGNDVDVVIG